MNLSKNIHLLNEINTSLSSIDSNTSIYDKTVDIGTTVSNIDANISTINTNINDTLDVNITDLQAFTKGISNTGAGTINVVNATDDPNLSTINDNISTINNNIADIGVTMSFKTHGIWQLKKNNSDVYDTDTAGTGNRFYYVRNSTGDDVFVKNIFFTYITTSNVLSYDGLLDNADNSNQFRLGKATTTNTIDSWYNNLGSLTTGTLWPFLVSESQLNDASGNYIYSFKIPVNYTVSNSEYVMIKIHNTFDSDMTALTFQAEIEY